MTEMESNEEILTRVVTAIEQIRVEDFSECHNEFNASCEYLAKSFEVSKHSSSLNRNM